MNPPQPTTRDPVCGMSVDPAKTQYTHEHEGTKYYFCAPACREQFIADPTKFLPKAQPVVVRKRPALGKELMIAGGIFVAVVAVLIMGRGIAKQQTTKNSDAVVMGQSAGKHEAVDAGQGNVITTVTHEPNKSSDQETAFTVALNTHSVNLTTFNPNEQIRLQEGDQEVAPSEAVASGERSEHHQNYQVTFPVQATPVMFVLIRNVAGVSRTLPFNL